MEYKDISHIEFYHLETSKAIFWNNGEFVYFYDDAVNNLLNSDTVIKDNKQNIYSYSQDKIIEIDENDWEIWNVTLKYEIDHYYLYK